VPVRSTINHTYHCEMVQRVAVIGSGLAGLTTAYLLRREGVEVWLIEKVCSNAAELI